MDSDPQNGSSKKTFYMGAGLALGGAVGLFLGLIYLQDAVWGILIGAVIGMIVGAVLDIQQRKKDD